MKRTFLFGFVFFMTSFKIIASDFSNKVTSPDDNIDSVTQVHKEPLSRTKFVVISKNQENFNIIAEKATEITGLPVFVVRKLSGENRAVFAIDQSRLLEIIKTGLSDFYGVAHILEKPGIGTKVMGKKPVPQILIKLNPVNTPNLWSIVTNNANWQQRNDMLSNQITEITRVPIHSYTITEEGLKWVFVYPAVQKYQKKLSLGLASASGGGAVELIRLVKPFSAPN